MADSQRGTKRLYDKMNSLNSLSLGLQRFFNSENLSDVTIISASQSFHAHKVVLSAQSHYFASIFSGSWKESQTNHITLEDDQSGTVEAMLRFLYHLDPYSIPVEVSPTLSNVMLYITSDKYIIPDLTSLAKEQFAALARTTWKGDDFPTVISEIYKSTRKDDRVLRDVVLSTEHLQLDTCTTKPAFRDVVREVGEFSCALILHPTDGKLFSYSCLGPECSVTWWMMSVANTSCLTCPVCGANVDLSAVEYKKTNTWLMPGNCGHINLARKGIYSVFEFLVFFGTDVFTARKLQVH